MWAKIDKIKKKIIVKFRVGAINHLLIKTQQTMYYKRKKKIAVKIIKKTKSAKNGNLKFCIF